MIFLHTEERIMTDKRILKIPMNRVEGDLEVHVAIEDNVIVDAKSSGIMYRGFENLLKGRAAMDSLVITPRICGICGTAHLMTAAEALERVKGVICPDAAFYMRHIALAVEKIQSDIRHAFLMFTPDFLNPFYAKTKDFEEAVSRYEPFRGSTVIETVAETRHLPGIIALIGGQWPHSSYMVPGGVTSMPSENDLLKCAYILKRFRKWYENRVIGFDIESLNEIKSTDELFSLTLNSGEGRKSDLAFYLEYGKNIGLHTMGKSHGNYISCGIYGEQERKALGVSDDPYFMGGTLFGNDAAAMDQSFITECLSHAWYKSDDAPRHPSEGNTAPYASGEESKKYSWAKAPRYNGHPAETGPLASLMTARDALFTDLVKTIGESAYVRELARLLRPARLIAFVNRLLENPDMGSGYYNDPGDILEGDGFGLTESTRGMLGHWSSISDGKIENYQVITPTTWNASPRDENGVPGPWEKAMMDTEIKDPENPIELGHIIRSFDACLFCTVHFIDMKQSFFAHESFF